MTADVSKNVFALFSGRKRTRVGPTLAIAIFVTALVAVPLTLRAVDARNDPAPIVAADSTVVLVDTVASDPAPLDQAVVEGPILISVSDPAATAVSFGLFPAGSDEPMLVSQDLEGPQFDLIVSRTGGGTPLDSTQVANGAYELFLTISTADEDRRTAVGFIVANP